MTAINTVLAICFGVVGMLAMPEGPLWHRVGAFVLIWMSAQSIQDARPGITEWLRQLLRRMA